MLPTANQQIIEFKSLDEIQNYKNQEAISLTIGSFDAIHLGHQELMKETIAIAKQNNSIPALLTFKNHPRKTLKSQKSGASIFTFEHRMELIAKFGIQKIFVIYFSDKISQLSPNEFVQKILLDALNSKALITGEDFCFGKDRKGNTNLLKEVLTPKNIPVVIVKPLLKNNLPVSTTLIRSFLNERNIKEVNQLLGREYSLKGVVMQAFGRGHQIGFPTANIIPETDIMPTRGVYITNAIYKGFAKHSITNVGFNPTFSDDKSLTVETHILNETIPLHGETLEIIFLQFIRPEKKFTSVEELKKQIAEDVKIAKQFHGIQ